MNDSFIIMCRDSLTPNMRKEIKEIVSANSKEGENEGESTSTEDLLKKLIEITQEQNKHFESSDFFNKGVLIIALISLLASLVSIKVVISGNEWLLNWSIGLLGIFILSLIVVLIFQTLFSMRRKNKNQR